MSKNFFNTDIEVDYSEAPPEINSEEFLKVIKSRRSVRIYKDDPVEESHMELILDSALLAPNSSNLQPWKFFRVKNTQKKNELVKACLGQSAAKTAPELIVCVARTKSWKQNAKDLIELMEKESPIELPEVVYQYYKKIVPIAYNQGPFGLWGLIKKLGASIRGISKVTPREPTSQSEMKTWAAKSTALAAQNIMLTARALGYDSCPMEGYDSKRVGKIVGIEKGDFPIMVISIGKRADGGVYGPQFRLPRESFIEIID